MKYKILTTFILFLANLGFAQSKKEQIQLLTARLDSLKSIYTYDKQAYNEIINELELSINSKNMKVSEFYISLAIDKTKLTSNIEQNEQFDKEILSLSSQLKSIKDKIQLLTARLDSLKSIYTYDKQAYNEIINELELSINSKNMKVSEFYISLAIDKTKLTSNIEQNEQFDKEILSLSSQLKSIKDSLQEIINKQAIKLLDSTFIKKSNIELIQMMNVHDEDLGEEFVNQNDPEIKPIYEIEGKQLFELKGKKYCLVVVGVINPNDYHVSSGTNFIACFKIKEDQWTLLNPAMNTSYNPAVEFGIPAWIDKFVLFGDQSLAIILEGGYTGMGHSSGKRTIYGLNNLNQISLIYEGISSEDDQGNKGSSYFRNIDDNFEINFQKISKANHYDLVEIKKSHGKKVKTRTYKFNEKTFKYE